MFLRTINRIRKKVGFRLAFWFCAIFILSSLLLFSLGYFLLASSLKRQDRNSIDLKIEELAALYQTSGVNQLKREISIDKKFVKKNPFLIRLADIDNKTIVLSLPYQWLESNLKKLEEGDLIRHKRHIHLPVKDKRYTMEVKSVLLRNSHILQVGKSSEDRERILGHFREIFYSVMIPLIVLGLAGGVFVAHRSLHPVRNLIATLRDIESGKMHARVEARQTNDELDELITLFNTMLERIESLIRGMRDALDNIAHNLRTPMARFRGIAETALQPNPDGQSCEEALATCMEESDQILKMLNTLMDISEAEAGTMKLELGDVEVSALIDRVLDLYQYTAEDKGIHFNASVQKDLFIRVDQTRMGQALANLMDNAIKYSPNNSAVDIDAFKEGNQVVIRIMDRGMGIAEDELPRIYDRLFRGRQALNQKGLGLGLNLVKAIIQAHRGRLEVSSQTVKGSTFSIFLPSTD
jgi:signal transduction histidine kinase